jgi:hypothetical protein
MIMIETITAVGLLVAFVWWLYKVAHYVAPTKEEIEADHIGDLYR